MNKPIKSPHQRGNADRAINVNSGENRHANFTPVEVILQRLENVKKDVKGYRALCPACGGTSHKLTIVEGDDGRALVHCFGCNDTRTILDALGLKWRDIYPFRAWPKSPDEQRKEYRIMREAGWRSALGVLDFETVIVCLAYAQIIDGNPLSTEDHGRLLLAGKRIASAWRVLH